MANESNEAKNQREKFSINIAEHEVFEDIVRSRYLTSTELCQMVTKYFKSAFSDFEGSIFEVTQNSPVGQIALFFNHNESGKPDGRVAGITRAIPEESNIHSDILRKIKENDSYRRNGDRYYLTDDLCDVLEDMMLPMVYDRKSDKPQWNKVVAEVTQPAAQFNQYRLNLTKVSFVDPESFVAKIFGKTDADGENWEYGVRILRSTPQLIQNGGYQNDYLLEIKAVRESEVQRLCNMLGVVPSGALNIIR